MATQKEDKSWYESVWDWFSETAPKVADSVLNNQQKKYEANLIAEQQQLIAQQQADSNVLSFFGKEIHKDTLMWILGGSLVVAFIFALVKRR